MKIARRKLLAGGALAGGMLAVRPAFAATVPVQVKADGASPAFRAAFDRLVAFAQADIAAWGFPAITLSLRSAAGEVASAAVGFANLDTRAPLTTSHLFQIGSITKSFVAVALLRLADQGKIDLDRPVLEFAPDMPIADKRVTTAHIINHAAGFPGNAPPFPHETGGKLWSETTPGERFHYSNSGYDALAWLIQRASGLSFPAAIRALVMDPLGMAASEPVILTRDRPRFAHAYGPLLNDRAWFPGDRLTEGSWLDIERAAGSVASTPADMAKWVQFIGACATGGKQALLSAAAARRFTTPVIDAPDFGGAAKYGMGLAGFDVDGKPVLHHTGGMITFSSALTVDRATGGGAFASVNFTGLDGYRPRKVTAYGVMLVRALAAGTALPDAPKAETLPPVAEPGNLTGRWMGPGGLVLTVSDNAGKLSVAAGGVTGRLRGAGPRSFVTDHPLLCRHVLDFEGESGRAERLWWGSALLGRDAVPAQPAPNPKLVALAGRYLSNDPWVGSVTVVARGDKLLMDGMGEMVPHADGSWRSVSPAAVQERAWFDSFVNGQAQRFSFSGVELIRQS
ncbi:beta-lactamase family protein [Sandaracinobacter neustonicus]|uniref:Beta-lactamase family protein n=1 Tax=Sandaracinobacter neustonicus TaxID=1715348 RepID=A0A501XSA1_9SPHN|nr:serine hydrolase domain-containing protein [Sandaracinobacter neustonicus]TPE63632.1 beta-lactamase family protein [Sandaracinobacter neustonicus]